MMAACYTLDLYCSRDTVRTPRPRPGEHSFDRRPDSFTGETFAECWRKAWLRGWRAKGRPRFSQLHLCPGCVAAGFKVKALRERAS